MKNFIRFFGLTSVLVFVFPLILCFTALEKSMIAYSQTKDQCAEQFEKARKEYNLGNFKEAVELIEPCLKKPGISKIELADGYRLLGLVFIAQQLKKEASAAVKKLLLVVPDYKINPENDSPELQKIINETAPTIIPQITSITPDSTGTGKNNLTITVKGTNFVYGSEVRFEGKTAATTYVSNEELKAEIPAEDILKEGKFYVTVYSPILGGKVSNKEKLTVYGAPQASPVTPWKWIAIGGGAVVAAVIAIITLGGKSSSGAAPTLADPPARP